MRFETGVDRDRPFLAVAHDFDEHELILYADAAGEVVRAIIDAFGGDLVRSALGADSDPTVGEWYKPLGCRKWHFFVDYGSLCSSSFHLASAERWKGIGGADSCATCVKILNAREKERKTER